MTFYQRFRGDASCAFFTLDSTFLYQENRKPSRIGRGFLGEYPLCVAEQCAPVNSITLGLGSLQPEGFCSVVRLRPKRKVFAWLPQFIFKLDCFCPGLWADLSFAVTKADHRVCLFEQVATPSDIEGRKSVDDAFQDLKVFPDFADHTGVDDIELRFGYLMNYCEDDMISLYLLGSIPTGKRFDNSRWFQPLVGTRNGGVGFGVMFDSTLWYSEFSESECLFMAELKYRYRFKSHEKRIFDLCNGRLSRFLLVAPKEDPTCPVSATQFVRSCASVKPGHMLEWWLGLHYTCCNWGFELGYNLWWREREELCANKFDFENHGIYDLTRCENLTSHSRARISDAFGNGTPDTEFVELTPQDVCISSAAAQEALSHTFSGAIAYNNEWCSYPVSLAFGARYEIAGHKRHTSTLENWGVFGKISVSC